MQQTKGRGAYPRRLLRRVQSTALALVAGLPPPQLAPAHCLHPVEGFPPPGRSAWGSRGRAVALASRRPDLLDPPCTLSTAWRLRRAIPAFKRPFLVRLLPCILCLRGKPRAPRTESPRSSQWREAGEGLPLRRGENGGSERQPARQSPGWALSLLPAPYLPAIPGSPPPPAGLSAIFLGKRAQAPPTPPPAVPEGSGVTVQTVWDLGPASGTAHPSPGGCAPELVVPGGGS